MLILIQTPAQLKPDYQRILFDRIKAKINGEDSLGSLLSEVLCISQDAVYRRYRGETALTIDELEKICRHFNISLDGVLNMNTSKVMFEVPSLEDFDFSMEGYLENIRNGLHLIKSQGHPQLTMTITNTPLLQLLNYPHLVRFKLFFWAKTYLRLEDYRQVKFRYDKISEGAFSIGKEILQLYNSIPSAEVYDPELLRGFIREIYYYFKAHHFEDSTYALKLLETTDKFIDHLEEQARTGKKYIVGTNPPAFGCDFKMYHNETLNGMSSIHYKTDKSEGLYIAHNFMNFLHTNDQNYVNESVRVLEKQVANCSKISEVNESERNAYFFSIRSLIANYRRRIELDLSL